MTSNAGMAEKKVTVGFSAPKADQTRSILNSLGAYFRPEFLNRFDAIIPFAALKAEDLIKRRQFTAGSDSSVSINALDFPDPLIPFRTAFAQLLSPKALVEPEAKNATESAMH